MPAYRVFEIKPKPSIFSENFEPNDPAYEIRAMIDSNEQETYLKSITTMG